MSDILAFGSLEIDVKSMSVLRLRRSVEPGLCTTGLLALEWSEAHYALITSMKEQKGVKSSLDWFQNDQTTTNGWNKHKARGGSDWKTSAVEWNQVHVWEIKKKKVPKNNLEMTLWFHWNVLDYL